MNNIKIPMTRKELINIGKMLHPELASVLYDMLQHVPVKGRLLETGTGYGHSATFFSTILPEWTIYTVDGFGLFGDGRIHPHLDHTAVQNVVNQYKKSGNNNVVQVLGDAGSIPWEMPLDILYIDADHTEPGCRREFENYSPHLVKGGLLIFDDYIQPNNPNNGVKPVVDGLVGEYNMLAYDTFAILKKL